MTDRRTTMSETSIKTVVHMPAPPKGTVWLLRFNPDCDDATLWLYKRSRITGRNTGWAVDCEGLINSKDRYRSRLAITSASVDQITEAAVEAAHKLIQDFESEPEIRAAMEPKAAEVSQRLIIPVEVKRRR